MRRDSLYFEIKGAIMINFSDINNLNKEKIRNIIIKNWGSDQMITRGKAYNLLEHKGIIANDEESEILGILIYRIEGKECEILLLESFKSGVGVGSKLIEEVRKRCELERVKRLWLITSNDNTYSMKFYQKRGFDMVAVHKDAIKEARKREPSIPFNGVDDIEIKHEVEFEIRMEV